MVQSHNLKTGFLIRKFRQIGPKERVKIYQMLYKGHTLVDIAQASGFHRSTIYRELSRNSCAYDYRADLAAQQALLRRQAIRRKKMDRDSDLRNFVIAKLKIGWSPELISGRLEISAKKPIISTEAIYQYIYEGRPRSW